MAGAPRRLTRQAGTTTTSQVASFATCEETLPRTRRRRFVRGRDPSTITSACSAREASRIASAGSPSQIRNVARTPVRAPRERSPGHPTPGDRAPGPPGGGDRPAGAGCAARSRSGRSGRRARQPRAGSPHEKPPRRPRLVDRQEDPSSHWVCRRFHRSSLGERRRRTMSQPARSVGPTGPLARGREQALCYRESR